MSGNRTPDTRAMPTLPPPPSVDRSRASPWAVAGLVAAGLVVAAMFVLFSFGQDLFGSDPGNIDAYNREVLESCDLPSESTLVNTYVLGVSDRPGRWIRTMSYIWASPLTADELAGFYGAPGPGIWADVSDQRACKFGQRPFILVLGRWIDDGRAMDESTQTVGPGDIVADQFWTGGGAETTVIAAVPDNTRSFMLLRLGQLEVEGVFGLAPSAPDEQASS